MFHHTEYQMSKCAFSHRQCVNPTLLNTHQTLRIDEGQWHQLVNETDKPVKIIEIQYGENCIEDDIERVGVSDDYGKATK